MDPDTLLLELERLKKLSELEIDYTDAEGSLGDLTMLAAGIAGTPMSVINLIDAFTQWSIASYGLPTAQMPREDAVCPYTLTLKENLEVKDLSADERFRTKAYVTGDLRARYYFGVPLQTQEGYHIGTLCVLDRKENQISPEKAALLQLIAKEVVNRLASIQVMQRLKTVAKEAKDNQRKLAHDIRGPLGGIISLSQLVTAQGEESNMTEVLHFVNMIEKAGKSLLDLTDEILSSPKNNMVIQGLQFEAFNLQVLKEKLEKLYAPQASPKQISYTVEIKNGHETTPVAKRKLLQIVGNLVSNAIKFTPAGGRVEVELELSAAAQAKQIYIRVKDSGMGMDEASIDRIKAGTVSSSNGTQGESGFGLGLSLVRSLVDELGGTMHIESTPGKGSFFELSLPL